MREEDERTQRVVALGNDRLLGKAWSSVQRIARSNIWYGMVGIFSFRSRGSSGGTIGIRGR